VGAEDRPGGCQVDAEGGGEDGRAGQPADVFVGEREQEEALGDDRQERRQPQSLPGLPAPALEPLQGHQLGLSVGGHSRAMMAGDS